LVIVAFFAFSQIGQAGHAHPVGADRVELVGGDELLLGNGRRVSCRPPQPTLLTSVEMPPKASTVSGHHPSIAALSVTSQAMPRQSLPVSAAMAAAVCGGLLAVQVGDHHLRAGAAERPGDPRADVLGAARDDHVVAVHPEFGECVKTRS
jgi:hypothetical protein